MEEELDSVINGDRTCRLSVEVAAAANSRPLSRLLPQLRVTWKLRETLNAKEVLLMAGQTIEFPNTPCHTYLVARWCPSSNAQRIFAEQSLNKAYTTNWHGMRAGTDMGAETDPHVFPEGDRRETHLRLNRSSRFATAAELSASVVHQLSEPLTAMLANAQAAKRWLAAEPPNLMEAIASIDRIARDVRAVDKAMELIWALFNQEPLDRTETSNP